MHRRRLLPALAFLVAVAYFPFWDGGALTPRWMLLSIGVLLLWRTPIRMTAVHWVGLAFLAYAGLSYLWAPQLWDWARQMWQLVLLAGIFCLAAEEEDLTNTYLAFAVGIALSGYLAVLEEFDWLPLPNPNHPAGLLGNRNFLAETAVLALIVVLPQWRRRWMWPVYAGLLLAVALPRARGALFGLDVALILYFLRHNAIVGGALLLGTAAVAWLMLGEPSRPEIHYANTMILRLAIGWSTLAHATIFGHGLGSFFTEYPLWTPHVSIIGSRPDHPHNEVVYVIAELGLPGLLLWVAFFWLVLRRAVDVAQLAVAALLAIGLTSFPLHLPATGFVAALLAADAVIARRRVLSLQHDRRDALRGGMGSGDLERDQGGALAAARSGEGLSAA